MLGKLLDILDNKRTALFVLALMGAILILFQNCTVGFAKGHHGFLSSHGMAIARNLSYKTGFMMYHSMEIDKSGKVLYGAYNRFPVFSFAAIKAVISSFSNLSTQVYMARQLMNVFLICTIFTSFLILHELSGKPLLSLGATLLAFSSQYIHYYNDMIFNNIPSLCGFVLALHGITKYEKQGKEKQLYVKSLIGISLGWQVFSALWLWWLVRTVVLLKKEGLGSAREMLISTPTRAVIGCTVFGMLVLGFNFGVEKAMIGNVPSLSSMKWRLGLEANAYKEYTNEIAWSYYIPQQLERIVYMVIPGYAAVIPGYVAEWFPAIYYLSSAALLVVIASGAYFIRDNRALIVTLCFSGLFWVLLMKNHVVFHNFTSIYYIGLALVVYFIILYKFPRTVLMLVAIYAIFGFGYTSNAFNKDKSDISSKSIVADINVVTEDFQSITDIIGKNKKIYVDGDRTDIAIGYHAANYYLSGNYYTSLENSDYIISWNKYFNSYGLTSENKFVFLFKNVKPEQEEADQDA
jgi:hypothetical protein